MGILVAETGLKESKDVICLKITERGTNCYDFHYSAHVLVPFLSYY